MAAFNEMQDKGQVSQWLQRRFNLTGAAPSPALAPELFPVAVYENDRPENGYLKGEIPYSGARSSIAAVGTHCGVGIWNPANSGILCVVHTVRWVPLQDAVLVLSIASTNPFSTASSAASRDSRYATAAVQRGSNCVLGQRNDYADPDTLNGVATWAGVAGATAPDEWSHPVILSPGAQLVLINSDPNVQLRRVNFVFTERPVMPGELG